MCAGCPTEFNVEHALQAVSAVSTVPYLLPFKSINIFSVFLCVDLEVVLAHPLWAMNTKETPFESTVRTVKWVSLSEST